MFNFKSRIAAISLAATMIAAPALSATITVTKQGSNAFVNSSGQNGWHQGATFELDGVRRSGPAGMFRLTSTDIDGATRDFLAFCLQPLETLTLPKLHDMSTSLDGTVLGRLSALMDHAFHRVTNSTTAAAFQLAAWEIANESSGSLWLTDGTFRVTSSKSVTRKLAQRWLNRISNGKWAGSGDVTILSATGTQDLLTDIPAPVPVPAAGVMLVGGLAAMAGLRKRRKTRKT